MTYTAYTQLPSDGAAWQTVCLTCGAIVVRQDLHNRWHDELTHPTIDIDPDKVANMIRLFVSATGEHDA